MTAAPSGTFATKDGSINIAANKQEQWEAVAEELGIPELKADPRFQKRDARKKNRKELTPLLEEKLKLQPTLHWVKVLNKRGVPSGEILSLADALAATQVQHRQTIETIHAVEIGELKLFNLTAKFEKDSGKVESPPPRLSEHTEEILAGVGYTKEDIKLFREQGIV